MLSALSSSNPSAKKALPWKNCERKQNATGSGDGTWIQPVSGCSLGALGASGVTTLCCGAAVLATLGSELEQWWS